MGPRAVIAYIQSCSKIAQVAKPTEDVVFSARELKGRELFTISIPVLDSSVLLIPSMKKEKRNRLKWNKGNRKKYIENWIISLIKVIIHRM